MDGTTSRRSICMNKKNFILYGSLMVLLSMQMIFCIDPKISIITSVYKGDEFIEGFLADITRQTIFDQCELIMINANSPDNEEPVIKQYMTKFPNIIYKRLDKDPGLYGVWNMAITMSRGEYITNANLDDRLAHNCYQIHAAELDCNPDIMLVYSDRYYTLVANETFEKHTGAKFSPSPHFSKEIMHESWPCNNPMWRRTLHDMFGLFDATYKYSGDWEMWLRAVEGGAQFKKIDGYYALYFYNTHGLSTGTLFKPQKDAEDKKIRERYGSLWGKETFREVYQLACALERSSNGEQRTWALALSYYLKAFALNPLRAEPLVRIAKHYYLMHDNALTYLFANRACELPCPDNLDIEKELYLFTRYDLLAISAWYVGQYEKGEAAARKALEVNPDDERAKTNLKFYVDRKNQLT